MSKKFTHFFLLSSGFMSSRHHNLLGKERKFNIYQTFRGRPGSLLNVSYTLNLRPASRNPQKQPPIDVLKKRCSENVQQIYRGTPMPKCDFKQLYSNHISAWVFSCKFAAIFRTPFPRNTSGWLAASESQSIFGENFKNFLQN